MKASAVYLNHQDMCSESSSRDELLAGSELKTEEEHLNILTVAALVCIMPTHHLVYGNMHFEQINLSSIPLGWQHEKDYF